MRAPRPGPGRAVLARSKVVLPAPFDPVRE